ncbi:hypothetical protein QMK50_20500 [Pseudomonas sp. P5_152]|uniref:hypothetical protein n=1 Tax=Pseudomonas sp. P5_152 TaxID=3043442 RepID=UPI002A36E484|nr:hypothetical protein [Pseudomonas sp. P5_152]MDX9667348.1 hypothetical protein [Pseudomonas sp. P5_152]
MSGSFESHIALKGLDGEQLAELALLGIRYRALGAATIDFSDPSRLDVYWTGKRMVEKAVKDAVKARRGDPLADTKCGIAQGHLAALLNCSVIDNETYMTQYRLLLNRTR